MKKRKTKIDKTSQRAFKITSNVITPTSKILEEFKEDIVFQRRNPKGLSAANYMKE